MKVPKVLGAWAVVGLLASSFILVAKWVFLATPLNKVEGLAKTVGSI